MLIYNPLFDAKHCAYRFLSTMHILGGEIIQFNTLRLLDIIRLHPALLARISPLPSAFSQLKKQIQKVPKQYTTPCEPRKTLFQMRPIHNSVGNWLIAKGFISKQYFFEGIIKEILPPPIELIEIFEHDVLLNSSWFKTLAVELHSMKAVDFTIIKKRSGYMEYRYDPR